MKAFVSAICAILFLSSDLKATVNVLVSTNDGIVVAADSRLTLMDNGVTRIASDSQQKIFRIGKSCGVSCSGAAFLLDNSKRLRNIGSYIEEFKIRSKIDDSSIIYPDKIVEELAQYFSDLCGQIEFNLQQGQLEILLFGFDVQKKRRIYEITLPISKKKEDNSVEISYTLQEMQKSGSPGSIVKGQLDVYFRLIKGYDLSILNKEYYSQIKSDLDQLRYDVRYELMSLQDAIDFATYIVRATIESQRFNQKSVMGVGGDIDIALLTPEGFSWIKIKKYKVEGVLVQ